MYLPYAPPRDLCISAPTSSGKTLAYVVPIIEVLHKRTIPQLRALILVPTRDLAVQVRDVLEAVGKGSGLRYAMITGNHSFRHEQDQLVRSDSDVNRSPTDI
ncbi:DEAD/DEAH box helicase, partial [Escherichia coli]|nr:DEAD/DEAH box helicase [Escherichia coli]